MGSRSKKHNTAKWGEMKFADDTAIVSTSKDKTTHAMNALFSVHVTGRWGLTIIECFKDKGIGSVANQSSMMPELQFNSEIVEMVNEFKYLGSVLHSNGLTDVDIKLSVH